ncbi:MAG: efflux RND transporter periplasmic adaptor subunit [Syntrophomonas sp.]
MKLGFKEVGSKWKTKIKNMSKRKKWIIGIAVIVLIALGIFLSTRGEQPLPVQIMDLKKEDIERTVVSNGRLEAATHQDFFTPVDSTLMELRVKAGDRVKKGDVLGRLDSLELARKYKDALAVLAAKQSDLAKAEAVNDDLNFKEAEAQYQKAKNHLDRIDQLYKAGAVNIEERETALAEEAKAKTLYNEAKVKLEQDAGSRDKASLQAQVELAQQEVDQAKERMELATFVAAFDGVVTEVNVKEGNLVLEGNSIMELGKDDVLEVTAAVNEFDAGSLEIGQDVKISCLALLGQEFHGKVSKVGAAAVTQKTNSGETVNVPVTIQIKGKTGDLKIGYTVDLTISLRKENKVLAIPVEAIMERDGKKFVFIVQNGVAQERQVKTRMGNELKDIIASGLKAGDKVVLNPPSNLKTGRKVMSMPAGAANDQNN